MLNDKAILKRAIDKWGPELQIIVAIEELSELQKELTKHLRGKKNKEAIIEEIVDVEIMIEQLKIIFEIMDERLAGTRAVKIHKLRKLL